MSCISGAPGAQPQPLCVIALTGVMLPLSDQIFGKVKKDESHKDQTWSKSKTQESQMKKHLPLHMPEEPRHFPIHPATVLVSLYNVLYIFEK